MTKKNFNSSHIDRIAEKVRNSDCETASYTTQLFTSISQQKHAKKPRISTLKQLIIECLEANPSATQKNVIRYLENKRGEGVIESVTNEIIEWTSATGKAETTEICNLPNHITRARKIINSYR